MAAHKGGGPKPLNHLRDKRKKQYLKKELEEMEIKLDFTGVPDDRVREIAAELNVILNKVSHEGVSRGFHQYWTE